jgi:hypothetical protein
MMGLQAISEMLKLATPQVEEHNVFLFNFTSIRPRRARPDFVMERIVARLTVQAQTDFNFALSKE